MDGRMVDRLDSMFAIRRGRRMPFEAQTPAKRDDEWPPKTFVASSPAQQRSVRSPVPPRSANAVLAENRTHWYVDDSYAQPVNKLERRVAADAGAKKTVRSVVASLISQAQSAAAPPSASFNNNNNASSVRKSVQKPKLDENQNVATGGASRLDSAVQADWTPGDEGPDDDEWPQAELVDSCTQTSPVSLSRSSSFTWISEAELRSGDGEQSCRSSALISYVETEAAEQLAELDAELMLHVAKDRTKPVEDAESLMLSDVSGAETSEEDDDRTMREGNAQPVVASQNNNEGHFAPTREQPTPAQQALRSLAADAPTVQQPHRFVMPPDLLRLRDSSTSVYMRGQKTTDPRPYSLQQGASSQLANYQRSSVGAVQPSFTSVDDASARRRVDEKNAPRSSFLSEQRSGEAKDSLTKLRATPPAAAPVVTQRGLAGRFSMDGSAKASSDKRQSLDLPVGRSIDNWTRQPLSAAAASMLSMSESLYDNVQGLRRRLALDEAHSQLLRNAGAPGNDWLPPSPPDRADVFSPDSCTLTSDSSFATTPATPLEQARRPLPEDARYPAGKGAVAPAGMPRDMSIASGILADSESSPMTPDQGFAMLGSMKTIRERSEVQTVVATPDSVSSGLSDICTGRSNFAFQKNSTPATTKVATASPSSTSTETPTAQTLAASMPTLDRISASVASSAENLLDRAGSGTNLYSQGSDSGFSSSKERTELEARECVRWLRAAGFPQYAQMYEEQRFPIDVGAAQKDHTFLDQDSLEALFRRLRMLNHCALMKVDSALRKTPDDESDDDDVALSRQWRFQRKSRTWSRVGGEFAEATTDSGSSPRSQHQPCNESCDSIVTSGVEISESRPPPAQRWSKSATAVTTVAEITPYAAAPKRANLSSRPPEVHEGIAVATSSRPPARTVEDIEYSPKLPRHGSHRLQRSSSERIRDKAKAFVRRVPDLMRSSRRGRQPAAAPTAVEIGAPVLISHQSASSMNMRMFPTTATRQSTTVRQGATSEDAGRGAGLTALQVAEQLFRADSPMTPQPPTALQARSVRDHSAPPREFATRTAAPPSGSMSPRHQPWRHGKVFTANDASVLEGLSAAGGASSSSSATSSPAQQPKGTGGTQRQQNSSIDNIFVPMLPTVPGSSSPAQQRALLLGSNDSLVQQRRGGPVLANPWGAMSKSSGPALFSGGAASLQHLPTSAGGVPLVLFNPSFENLTKMSAYDRRGASEFSPPLLASALRVQVDGQDATRSNVLTHSSLESSDADSPKHWERRDSGVGSSLSRSPSVPTKPRVRWHSFQRQQKTTAGGSSLNPPFDALSVPQLGTLQKFALLKLTALMDKYSAVTKASGWQWNVQRFLRKMKSPENRTSSKDCLVFGASLTTIAQRTGQPLPQCILQAMKFLRQQAPDAHGLFRKPGVRSRIQKLRQQCESSLELVVFDSAQAYDVADMLKQYFRELPEPLMTGKLSETFLTIQLSLPSALVPEALQKAFLLLPDENREALHTLLMFLHDISLYCDTNQMTAQNLAVCFAPTLFQLSARVGALSPTRRHKTITGGGGLPNERELNENRAAQEVLAMMIVDCRRLFTVPSDILTKCNYSLGDESEPSPLRELGAPSGNYVSYLDGCVEALLKEHRDKWRGWMTAGSIDGVELSIKKVSNDDYPLKLWRCWADVEAPPRELLARVLRERNVWDDDVVKWRIVAKLSENSDLFQFVCNDMPPHSTRDFLVVRLWRTDMPELRGGCCLVETSVTVPEVTPLGGIRGVVLASRYLIEPCGSGRSRITHVCRIDTKGRSKRWYSKVFGHICGTQAARIRDSFRQQTEGPETKV